MWFGRVRRKDTGEIIPLEVTEIHGAPDGQIRPWINIPTQDGAWIECDLELYTGFVDRNKKYIYEGDKVSFAGYTFSVEFNHFTGQWVIVRGTGHVALCDVWAECYVIQENKGGIKNEN